MPWKEFQTPEGVAYYYNDTTQETSWDKPPELRTSDDVDDRGDWVWCPHETNGYVPAQVLATGADGSKTLKLEDGSRITLKEKEGAGNLVPLSRVAMKKDTDDLVQMDRIDEGMIVNNLRQRFLKDSIYTNVGTILISVNPFKNLPLYTPTVMDKYINKGNRILPPHIFEIAASAFSEMTARGADQSVLISGESGAGKTEATKQVLAYLAEVAGSETRVEQKVLQANPILEAFGNAKTLRNNNSSRFGKWMEIFFDKRNKICGSRVQQYLLEKSRVVFQIEGERNYHIFYMLCKGLNAEQRAKYHIGKAEEFHYCMRGNCSEIPGVNDLGVYNEMIEAMQTIGFTDEEKDSVFTVVAAVLHLGNIMFDPDTGKMTNKESVQIVAELIKVKPDELEAAIGNRTMQVRGQADMVIPLNAQQASDNRDALAKAIYGNMFDWLVQRINVSMDTDARSTTHLIGVLDIFGFEIFDKNSFEQLCINYCNEKLQQHFNQHTFKLEEELYRDEGIKYEHVTFIDNQIVLDLVEAKPKGIVAMLDEEIVMPRGTDQSLLQKMHAQYDKKHERYRKPLRPPDSFVIVHYAGEVTYDINGFLEKNKDVLYDDLYKMIGVSGLPFLKELFKKSAGHNKTSLGAQFKQQLGDLMNTLNRTMPHYVRCIKPNSLKVGGRFEGKNVLLQLRYSGVFEAVRIRQTGFPFRWTHPEFVLRYRILDRMVSGKTPLEHCQKLVATVNGDMSELQFGTTRVLYRAKTHRMLELLRNVAFEKRCIIIQKYFRRYRCQKLYKKMKVSHVELTDAIGARDLAMLEAAITKASDIWFEMKSLKDARTLRALIIEENKCIAELGAVKALDPEKFFDRIQRALKAAAAVHLDHPLVDEVEKHVFDTKMRREALAELKQALKDVSLPGLTAGLAKGRQYNLRDPVMKESEELQKRLEAENSLQAALNDAMNNGAMREREYATADITKLKEHTTKGASIELLQQGVKDTLAKAQALLKVRSAIKVEDWDNLDTALREIAAFSFTDAAAHEIKRAREELALKAAKDKVVERMTEGLANVDGALLAIELEKAVALGMRDEPEHGTLLGEVDRILALVDEARASLVYGIDNWSVEYVTQGVAQAEAFGYETDEVARARVLRDSINHYTNYAKAALVTLERPELEEALAGCRRFHVQNEDVNTIINYVEKMSHMQFYAAQLKLCKDNRDVARGVKVSIEMKEEHFNANSNANYTLEAYPMMRTREEYGKGTLLHRGRNRDTMFIWTEHDLPNSLTRLDDEANKKACKLFKNVQGYMHDRKYSYEAQLAQDCIDQASPSMQLRDEIYAQLIKQLTNNESKKKESEPRGWELMRLIVQAFPASEGFTDYVEFFLRTRGRSAAIGFQTDLLKWYHESLFTGGGPVSCEHPKTTRPIDAPYVTPHSDYLGAAVITNHPARKGQQAPRAAAAPAPAPAPAPALAPVPRAAPPPVYVEPEKARKFCRALYAFTGENADELVLKKGDIVEITNDESSNGWWEGCFKGTRGVFPANYVEVLQNYSPPEDLARPAPKPAPPPPPPTPPPAAALAAAVPPPPSGVPPPPAGLPPPPAALPPPPSALPPPPGALPPPPSGAPPPPPAGLPPPPGGLPPPPGAKPGVPKAKPEVHSKPEVHAKPAVSPKPAAGPPATAPKPPIALPTAAGGGEDGTPHLTMKQRAALIAGGIHGGPPPPASS